jgi:hypothetical protein
MDYDKQIGKIYLNSIKMLETYNLKYEFDIDIYNTVKDMKSRDTYIYFVKKCNYLLKNVKNPVNRNSLKATFDIVFKYMFDVEIENLFGFYKINNFKLLQCDILKKCDWSISELEPSDECI